MHWRDRFERFATRGNLTEEERQRALRVLADTQLQADAYWELLGDALTDARPPSETPDLSDLETSLEETTLNSLRTFLTSKQMIEFRRRATLSGPYLLYGIIDPLDIEPLPAE